DAWWGTPWGIPRWPVAGPDVTGGNVPNTGGLADKIPARLCYENSVADTAYAVDASGLRPIVFNAATCYIGSSGSTIVAPGRGSLGWSGWSSLVNLAIRPLGSVRGILILIMLTAAVAARRRCYVVATDRS